MQRSPVLSLTLLLALCAVILGAWFAVSPLSAQEDSPAATDAPEYVDNSRATLMTSGGGFVYWAYFSASGGPRDAAEIPTAPDVSTAEGYLKRLPANGGKVSQITNAEIGYQSLHANDVGIYYYRASAGGIVLRPHSDPASEILMVHTAAPTSLIVSDVRSDKIYWLASGRLWYAERALSTLSGGQSGDMAYTGANGHDLTLGDGNLYWFGDDKIYYVNKLCTYPGSNCQRSVLTTASGNGLTYHYVSGLQVGSYSYLHWVSPNPHTELRAYSCTQSPLPPGNVSCGVSTTYSTGAANIQIRRSLAGYGNSLFWVESDPVNSVIPPEVKRYRFNVFGAGAETIAGGQGQSYKVRPDSGLTAASRWVYFSVTAGDVGRIARLRSDAPPILADLAAVGMEITQGISRPANDTPVVAGKSTYVRAYGRKVSGPRVNNVPAILQGWRGNTLVGTLRPLNGALSFPLPGGLQLPLSSDRSSLETGWLFYLPAAWTNAGDLRLRLTVNHDLFGGEPNSANNVSEMIVNFADKAPICVVFIPVRTANTATLFTPSHNFAIQIARRLLPAADIWVYHQDSDIAEREARLGVPPWKYGPYEPKDDSEKMLISLYVRDQLSDDPDECDDAGARTHYVGVVDGGEEGNNGAAWPGHDNMWFRLPPVDFSKDWRTDRAVTLAHELGHNYSRPHINCPEGDPENVGNYPYPVCQLDFDDNPDRHYGFSRHYLTGQFEVIRPTTAADLLSYAHRLNPPKERWISDYNWRALLDSIPNWDRGARAQAEAPRLAQADEVVLISGWVDTQDPAASTLNHAWVFPSASVSGAMIAKWQRTAAPSLAEAQAAGIATNLHLRLLAADGAILDERAVLLMDAADETGPQRGFYLTFPAPVGPVSRIELRDGDLLLSSLQPGPNPPTVQVLAPTGGTVVDETMTISWRASDADAEDRLLFTVQYSPDDGQSWRALLTEYPNLGADEIITVDLRSLGALPASIAGARIRVGASDGYHTTFALSQPFTLNDQGPQPRIDVPGPGFRSSAGHRIIFEGAAVDAEDGPIPGSALNWSITGPFAGTVTFGGENSILAGLGPGDYSASLTATDSGQRSRTRVADFSIAPLFIPAMPAESAPPEFDGLCDDDGYASAQRLPLNPYTTGKQATVLVTRTATHLWVCFMDLYLIDSLRSPATLYLDTNESGGGAPQVGDYRFRLYGDGAPVTHQGNGAGWVADTASGIIGQVSADTATWNAEFKMPAALFNAWQSGVSLLFEHSTVVSTDDYRWPYRSDKLAPDTWARTLFSVAPEATALEPISATVGEAGFTLIVTGSGFRQGAKVLWNGMERATTFVDATSLQAAIPATDLLGAGEAQVMVQSSDRSQPTSAPLTFTIYNRTPAITRATLAGTTLTVEGSDFADGATLLWDGLPQTTSFVTATQLRAEIPAHLIPANGVVEVAAANPQPAWGPSASWALTMGAVENQIFLPSLQR
ncbi:MAG: IPT/TIG domain-containing protein [Caldilineaceae bacterium]|nr:IPT/TIG domain-containing protein [Caldilineaceae bacterium]